MTIKNTMQKIAAISIVVFSFVGCEDDFETLGGNIIGEPGFNAELYDEAAITATSFEFGPVQTNNLPVNLLGYYNHEVFGAQTANLLTQLSLPTANPAFGNDPQLDSVVLNIPYFHTELEPTINGDPLYQLDSIFGNSPIKLTVLESNFFLNDFDPETNFQQSQKYYSDMHSRIEEHLTGEVLYETDEFFPSREEIVEYGYNDEGEADTLTLPPAFRIKLSTEFFQNKILDAEGSTGLSSNSNFKNYLRGLYIKAEPIGDQGNLMMLNLFQGEAGITLYYTTEDADEDDTDGDGDTEEVVRVPRSYELGFGGGTVNAFQQDLPDFNDNDLVLKGGEGAMAVIEIFSGQDTDEDGISDELEFVRDNNWLINEANLTFHVNRAVMQGSEEPEQLYLFDLDNNRILADYVFDDPAQANSLASTANRNHLVPLERDDDGNGILYKIRLTSHINNVLNRDSTNVKLGLVVSENVNLLTNSALKNSPHPEVDRVPASTVIAPLGTVLYGPEAENEDKRLKLNIYYTEAKE